ncbi:MAG: hypothetical protein IJV73_00135, partial [Clostridia bacterium]|nr:hypothetical protein [Clostridia bacterium]
MATLECIAIHTRKICQIPAQTVICLGNFDGVHLAHRKLLRIAVKHRNSDFADAACCVLCFRTPSSDYLSKTPAAHLCTLEQKLDRFAEEGIEYAILCDFPDIRALSPKEFAEEILRDGCHCVAAVCGFNYRFGKNG